ncbi:hypothetical protein [Mycobacterium sp. SM1]|nr:hypothetical protein [Mycobacterium sp. SM1]
MAPATAAVRPWPDHRVSSTVVWAVLDRASAGWREFTTPRAGRGC